MLKKAFIDAWKNFRVYLVIPDLSIVLFSLLSILYFTSFSKIAGTSFTPEGITSLVLSSLPNFRVFLIENWLVIITTVIIFIFMQYFLGSGILAMKYGLFKDVINNKRFNIKSLLKYSARFILKVFILRLLIGIVATLIIITSLIFFFIVQVIFEVRIALLLSVLIFILLIGIFRLAVIFRYATMYLNNQSSWESLKESSNFIRKKPIFLLSTFLIITITGFIINSISSALNFLIGFIFGDISLLVLQGLIDDIDVKIRQVKWENWKP